MLHSLTTGRMDTVVGFLDTVDLSSTKKLQGKNQLEDQGAMVRKYPLPNAYWKDKRARVENISIPMYVLASFSSGLHTEGSLRGFLFSSSKEKW